MSEPLIKDEWQLNQAQLKPRMIIRMPGDTKELGQVYKVSGGQATYKASDGGKSQVIPASAEVEFRWPSAAAGKTPVTTDPATINTDEEAPAPAPAKKSRKSRAARQPQQHPDPSDEQQEQENLPLEDEQPVAPLIDLDSEDQTSSDDRQPDPEVEEIEQEEEVEHDSNENSQPETSEQETDPAMLQDDNDAYISVEQVANETGKSAAKINALRRNAEIPSYMYKRQGKLYLYREDVVDLIQNMPKKSPGRRPGSGSSSVNTGPISTRSSMAAARTPSSSGLISLPDIAKQLNVPYPTLVRLARLHENELPSEGTGRNRKFYPEAVKVFERLKDESSGRRGRKPGSAATASTSTSSASNTASTTRTSRRPVYQSESEPSFSSSSALRPSPSFLSHPSISKDVHAHLEATEVILSKLQAERERLDNVIEQLTAQRALLIGS